MKPLISEVELSTIYKHYAAIYGDLSRIEYQESTTDRIVLKIFISDPNKKIINNHEKHGSIDVVFGHEPKLMA